MKITCNPKDISKILNAMASAASEDPTRTNIQGVNVIARDTMLMFQSTNGHYAFKITIELNESVADQTFVMAPKRVQEILAHAKVDAKYKKDLVEYDLGNEPGTFPRFDRLGFGDKAEKTDTYCNPAYLADIMSAAAKILGKSEAVRVLMADGPGRPIKIKGETVWMSPPFGTVTFEAILMPMREPKECT